uniref:Uncharacterized protein n=1 Tax=Opuntia streptacantha TaxID=393608 RepID=A0A7C9E0L7_OPUST
MGKFLSLSHVLILIFLMKSSIFCPHLHAMPPPNPIQCNATSCTLHNAYGVWGDRRDCGSSKLVYPATEEELRLAVANANQNNLKVKFKLEGAFKRSITLNFTKDEGIEDEYMEHGKKYEFGDIGWYPSAYTAVYRYDQRLPLTTSGDAVNDFLGFQSQSVLVSSATRAIGIVFLISPPKCFRQLLYIPIYIFQHV